MLMLIKVTVILVVVILWILYMEVGRTPYDLVEGESELVSRFNTEFSGGIFTLFFLAEYGMLVAFSILLNLQFFVAMWVVIYILTRRS